MPRAACGGSLGAFLIDFSVPDLDFDTFTRFGS